MLRRILLTRFGNLVAGWRGALDQDGSGGVSREEFMDACRWLQFPGDAQAVFEALADGDELSLYALDKEAAEVLSEFALFIRDEFGTVDAAFASGLARGMAQSMSVDFQTFMHACLEMRFHSRNFKRLFDYLDFNGSGELTLEELRFLERWRSDIFVPPPPLDQRLDEALRDTRPMDEICGLVEMGANCNRMGRNGRHDFNLALHQAVESGSELHVQRLLACHADPRLANAYGQTPLHGAAGRRTERVDPTVLIHNLCAAQADPNVSTADGTTPLHVACAAGQAETVATLAYLGADVHARDAQNRGPLWLSVIRKSLPCCCALLEFLADPCRREKGGRTALAYASQTRQGEIAETLIAHVQDNYKVLLRAAVSDAGNSFKETPYMQLLGHLPPLELEEAYGMCRDYPRARPL
jgi:Ca2+-binding EF-hand superfamily protein